MIEIDLRHYKLQNTQREENNSFLGFKGIDYGRIIKNTSKEWSSKKKQHFFQDLAILLGSGVDLSMSLQVMVDSTNVQAEKKALNEINESLIKGNSFADTIKKTKQLFRLRISLY